MAKPTEITPVEIVAEATEEVKEAPSRLRRKLREIDAQWELIGRHYLATLPLEAPGSAKGKH
jgi:hypothetical protein